MLICLVLLYIVAPLNVESIRKVNISTADLKRLNELQYNLCGLTLSGQTANGIGWFCVPNANCSGTERGTQISAGTQSDLSCDALRYNEGYDTCCYSSHVSPSFSWLGTDNPEWDLYTYVKNTSATQDIAVMTEHREALFDGYLTGEKAEIEQALDNHEICHIMAVNKEKGRTTYTPYLCVTTEECEGEQHDSVYYDIKFPFGDRFCKKSITNSKDRPVCCHISTVIQPDEEDQIWWELIEVKETQKYAPGFRAKLMCEQYNKLVCDGEVDRCAQKVPNRYGLTLPGEFPHHALVGISLPKRQTFHCHGAIISKLFVLSSYDCRMTDLTLANIVIVGTFSFELDQKTTVSVNEEISYVKNHISRHDLHSFLLLKLWRPLRMSPFIKPACIDWYSIDKDLRSKHFDFGTGWIVGYGSKTKDGNFTTNVLRHNFNLYSTVIPGEKLNNVKCQQRFPKSRLDFIKKDEFERSENHICLYKGTIYSPYVDQRNIMAKDSNRSGQIGYFSQGAPFSVFERYCQWKVYGINIQGENFQNNPPLLVETLPHALAWIEEVVWKNDFDWLLFNLSWPECADWENKTFSPSRKAGKANEALHQFNFYTEDYHYIKPEYDDYYNL